MTDNLQQIADIYKKFIEQQKEWKKLMMELKKITDNLTPEEAGQLVDVIWPLLIESENLAKEIKKIGKI